VLNPIIKPGLAGLMRTGAHTQIAVLTGGFALIVAVLTLLLTMVRATRHWAARGFVVGLLLSLACFFGTYTFLSGWTVLPTVEMCRTAIADTVTVVIGAILIAFVQDYRRA